MTDDKWRYVIYWTVEFFLPDFARQDKIALAAAKDLNETLQIRAKPQSTPNGQQIRYEKGIPVKIFSQAVQQVKERHPVNIHIQTAKIGKVPFSARLENLVK